MFIDAYTHIFPAAFFDELTKSVSALGNLAARLKSVRSILDLDSRFRDMDAAGDCRQIISLPHPALEEVASPEVAARLSQLANDGLAGLCRRHPDRFPAFVATVPMSDVRAAVAEAERAVSQLGAKGIQIYTNVAGRPLDDPEFEPVFAVMARHGLPIWLHPARSAAMPDYASERKSRYEMWWCFGWPYETSVAVSRLVFSGIFDRYPGLKIITHHLGGMIPFFDGRIGPGMDVLGARTPDEDYSAVLKSLKRPHLDYFKTIYADTAMFGGACGLPSGLKFFGSEHIVFASDAPFAPIGPTLAALDEMNLSAADRANILHRNIETLLGTTFS